tara:strand:- start:294 stop:563 length:270 start_codon:yes stop_codon:yes gene_type:complete
MKSYLQGMITGGVLVFATIVFMGQSSNEIIQDLYHKDIMKRFDKVDEQLSYSGTIMKSLRLVERGVLDIQLYKANEETLEKIHNCSCKN